MASGLSLPSALLAVAPAAPVGVRELLLLVAVERAAELGLARLSMGEVARRAGVSRQTLYRYFSSKQELLAAAVSVETELVLAASLEAARAASTGHERLQAALCHALKASRQHPLLQRLLHREPESLLPLLLTDGGPVMARVRDTLEWLLGDLGVPVGRRSAVADLLACLVLSHAVQSDDREDDHAALWTELALSSAPTCRAAAYGVSL
jgi:AcrR family transcriptional regulator